ncbi:MAG: glycosyltransferase family 2 protein [Ginsengibacter sp.]
MYLLSAVIITYNEEKNIGKCIEALQKVADEIIVVDNYSTDETQSICDQYGVKFLQKEWSGFGPQKRFGVKAAKYDQIIALDADEILDDDAIEEIKILKENGLRGVYEIKMYHYYFGKFLNYGQEYPNYKKRIFDRKTVNWNNNLVHEALVIPEDCPVIKLKGKIYHYSYHSISQYISKSNNYTGSAAREMFAAGRKSYLLKLLVSPSFTFLNSYFIKRGFMDGWHGFVIAMLNGYSNFLKYAKLGELLKREKREGS